MTDLKSAIRYLRYNSDLIPGDSERMFVFGMSGGGAQTAVAGASGDSSLYTPYFNSLGSALTDRTGATLSDAITGAMCWCPITSLDWANAAYEWNMGQFAATGTRAKGTWTKVYSNDLANAFGKYINMLGLKTAAGKTLSLKRSASGEYLAGSYYDHLIEVIETSLNDFLSYTKFPYTQSSGMGGAGGATGAMSSGAPSGGGPSGSSTSTTGTGTSTSASAPSGGAPSGGAPSGGAPSGGGPSGSSTSATGTGTSTAAGAPSGGAPAGSAPSGSTTTAAAGGGGPSGAMPGGAGSGKTFKTVEKYIAYLNESHHWVDYDSSTKRAKVLNLRGFVTSQKPPTKNVGAFDGVDRGETENLVLGHGTDPLHFARISRTLIAARQNVYQKYSDWKASYGADSYDHDFALTDTIGKNQAYRVNAYNPMYFLSDYYDGYKSAKVAPHWRIRTGIMQGDTANTVELNLALALQSYGVKNVDFATVWGEAHTMAETTGQPTTNFISWVKRSVA